MNGVNKGLTTQKIKKTKKKLMNLFESLMLSKVKFNILEAFSR